MEVCVDNIQSAINAADGGATRIELCSALSEGGLTPSIGIFKTIKQLINISVFVMLRPRRGMDFVYTENEIEAMKYDALQLKNAGADGFVFGVLNENGTVNVTACTEILRLVDPLPTTFHRAFDCVIDPFDSLNSIINLGFHRILTSGQKKSAINGIELIRKLIELSRNRIVIVPGAGINENNAYDILNYTGAKELHGSVRVPIKQSFSGNCEVSMGSSDSHFDLLVTEVNAVNKIVSIIKKFK